MIVRLYITSVSNPDYCHVHTAQKYNVMHCEFCLLCDTNYYGNHKLLPQHMSLNRPLGKGGSQFHLANNTENIEGDILALFHENLL